jgi:hypothetical protein
MTTSNKAELKKMELYLNHLLNRKIWAAGGITRYGCGRSNNDGEIADL